MAQTKLPGVRAVIADAQRDLARQRRRRNDPPPLEARGEPATRAGQWTPDRLGLPKEDPSPVTMLGREGEVYHLIDSDGQFRSMAASDFSHSGIQALFSATPHYPEWAWPRLGGRKNIDLEEAFAEVDEDEGGKKKRPQVRIESFKDDDVRKSLFRAASLRGLFNPHDRLRGRGAWTDRGGNLLYHAGEDLWVSEGGKLKEIGTGLHYGHLYPRLSPVPAPWSVEVGPADNPARELVTAFRTWSWERPDVDPLLLLGWIGVALMGGALRWRSAVFLTGDKGTGKSTLQDLVKAVLGEAVVTTAQTTAAGIYQLMRHDSRAVAVDEIEASADNRRQMSVIELARVASSGALGLRGGADGTGTEFTVRCAFLFSAINPPPLSSQDLSRIAVLRLAPLDPKRAGEARPLLHADGGGEMVEGRMLLRRLMDEWHRWETTLAAYRETLGHGGHNGRGQDTYGTLLAMADMLLGPELATELGVPMVDDLSAWSTLLGAAALPEVDDALPNWRQCLEHLLGSRVPAWRDGHRATVGQLLQDLEDAVIEPAYARQQLGIAGLGLLDRGWEPGAEYGLAVPNRSSGVAELYAGTAWQGSAGGQGGWVEALRQGRPSGVVLANAAKNRPRINGMQGRCTLIDMGAFRKLS